MERLKLFLVLSIIFLLVTWSSCSLDVEDSRKSIIGEGPVVMHVIQADTFDTFRHLSVGNVNITTGDSLEIYLKAQQNIIDEMLFDFDDGVFSWGFNEQVSIQSADTIMLTINMPNVLEGVQVGGLGTINIQGNKQDDIYFNVFGYAEINSYSLEVDNCDINIIGTATCYIRVNNELTGLISGIGNVYYKGEPQINVAITGQGDVIEDN
jgi:hypothetical protein